MNNDKDQNVAQESARNGSLRTGGAGDSARIGGGASEVNGVTNEEVIRKWYAAWEKKDLATFKILLADGFTFTSATGDGHISKGAFKAQCWDTEVDFIGHLSSSGSSLAPYDAFVKYLCHTENGKSFRKIEYLRIKNGKLESIEFYFGAQSSFPSAVSTGQN
jgi:hypothetical protein